MNNNEIIDLINEKYDINKDHNAKIELDFTYDDEYNITAIIGGSGTGKTTLLKKWFNLESTTFNFNNDNLIFIYIYNSIKYFDKTFQLLFDVRLTSVPMWKNSFNQISNGEKLRFEIAYKLSSDDEIIFVDEFTSMLDRQVAKNLTKNINKLVDKYHKKLVISTAHYDVLDWIKIDRLVDTTLKKAHSPQTHLHLTHTLWKSEVYQKICGEYLSTIII